MLPKAMHVARATGEQKGLGYRYELPFHGYEKLISAYYPRARWRMRPGRLETDMLHYSSSGPIISYPCQWQRGTR